MKKLPLIIFSIFIVILLVGSIGFYRKPFLEGQADEKIHGFNLVAPRDKFPLDSLKVIQSIGAEWIAVVPYAFCDPETGAIIYGNGRQWWGETPEGISTTIEMAHSIGLKVMLKPHLWVKGQGWAGDLTFATDSMWQNWEANYANYLKTYTEVAKKTNVDLFCIGTEIRKSTKMRKAYWEDLISTIKRQYNGPLTYAANWDEFEEVTFWDKLDFIGVDAYFPILSHKTPQVESLKLAWDPPKNRLAFLSMKYKKKVLFTEFGYESADYPAIGHWNVNKDSLAVNHEAQRNTFEALFQTFVPLDWWAGGFVWKWHLNLKGNGDRISKSYTPQQKPALEVISKYFESNNIQVNTEH